MGISVILKTKEFRGDHEADVTEAHTLAPGETVEELVGRLVVHDTDTIELRRAVGPMLVED